MGCVGVICGGGCAAVGCVPLWSLDFRTSNAAVGDCGSLGCAGCDGCAGAV